MADSLYGGGASGPGGAGGVIDGGSMTLWTNPIFLLILVVALAAIAWALVAIGVIALISALLFIKIIVGFVLLIFCFLAISKMGESGGTMMLWVGLALGAAGAILILWGLADAGVL